MDNGSEFLKEGAIVEFFLSKDLNVGQVSVHLLSHSVKHLNCHLKGFSHYFHALVCLLNCLRRCI